MYSFSGNCAAAQSQFPHSCVCEQFLILTGFGHLFSCSRIGRPIMGILKSLTDTWMWKLKLRGRTVPFLGIFVLNSQYCLFAVHATHWLATRRSGAAAHWSDQHLLENWGRKNPFLGIVVSNFRYCVFAVCWTFTAASHQQARTSLVWRREFIRRQCLQWRKQSCRWQKRSVRFPPPPATSPSDSFSPALQHTRRHFNNKTNRLNDVKVIEKNTLQLRRHGRSL
jgi:hypothetical protein